MTAAELLSGVEAAAAALTKGTGRIFINGQLDSMEEFRELAKRPGVKTRTEQRFAIAEWTLGPVEAEAWAKENS